MHLQPTSTYLVPALSPHPPTTAPNPPPPLQDPRLLAAARHLAPGTYDVELAWRAVQPRPHVPDFTRFTGHGLLVGAKACVHVRACTCSVGVRGLEGERQGSSPGATQHTQTAAPCARLHTRACSFTLLHAPPRIQDEEEEFVEADGGELPYGARLVLQVGWGPAATAAGGIAMRRDAWGAWPWPRPVACKGLVQVDSVRDHISIPTMLHMPCAFVSCDLMRPCDLMRLPSPVCWCPWPRLQVGEAKDAVLRRRDAAPGPQRMRLALGRAEDVAGADPAYLHPTGHLPLPDPGLDEPLRCASDRGLTRVRVAHVAWRVWPWAPAWAWLRWSGGRCGCAGVSLLNISVTDVTEKR